MTDIKYDASRHEEFKKQLTEVEKAFKDVITEFESVEKIVTSDFKGNAAKALQVALQTKITQLKKEADDWETVMSNADQIEVAFKESDEKSAKVVKR